MPLIRLLPITAATLLMLSCGEESAATFGEVVVLVTDHREAIDDFSRAIVTIEAVELHRRGALPADGWVRLAGIRGSLDLTEYRDREIELGRAPVPARRYDALRLVAGPIEGTLAVQGAEGTKVEVPFAPSAAALALRVLPDDAVHVLVDITINDVRDHPGESYRGVIFSVGQTDPGAPS